MKNQFPEFFSNSKADFHHSYDTTSVSVQENSKVIKISKSLQVITLHVKTVHWYIFSYIYMIFSPIAKSQ